FTTSTPSTPHRRISSILSSGVRIRRGARWGARTLAGIGLNVSANDVPFAARARSIAVLRIARWPRWTPSKLPSATTGNGLGGIESRSWIIFIGPNLTVEAACSSILFEVPHHRVGRRGLGRIAVIGDQLLQREPRVNTILELHESLGFAQQRRAREAALRI